MLVDTNQGRYIFEVKAPALIEHQLLRSSNSTQLPARVFDKVTAEKMFGSKDTTLPRDNPVKDFLISADEKFKPFRTKCDALGILIIVWDDFIYEPITALVHEHSGLLTPKSFAKDANGAPITFPNVDAVILVRHLTYFQNAAGDQSLLERVHAFDFGDPNGLPNVYIPLSGGRLLPTFLLRGLRAHSLDEPFMQMAAEYRPQDLVWWHNV